MCPECTTKAVRATEIHNEAVRLHISLGLPMSNSKGAVEFLGSSGTYVLCEHQIQRRTTMIPNDDEGVDAIPVLAEGDVRRIVREEIAKMLCPSCHKAQVGARGVHDFINDCPACRKSATGQPGEP